jgi:hypothetical protein
MLMDARPSLVDLVSPGSTDDAAAVERESGLSVRPMSGASDPRG